MKKKTTTGKGHDSIKLDLGCGKNKKQGFLGVDIRRFDGVDVVVDLGSKRWPWKDATVAEVNCSHFLEHLTPKERIHVVNEMWRVLKPGGQATCATPHWASTRAYGDLTHKWPPVSEFWLFYLNKEWRATNAPHNDEYECDFQAGWGYTLHPALQVRADEQKNYALANYKEAAQDLVFTLTKPVPVKKA